MNRMRKSGTKKIIVLKFVTHRPLWVNILAGFLLAVGFFSLVLLSLNWLTHHNESRTVPSVTGKSLDDARTILKRAGFEIEIQDSIYTDTAKPLVILKQVPESDEVVKVNRTVYLTISRTVPPYVEMPNLVGYSFRNAEMVLKIMNIRIGDTTFKPDFAKNSVLEQLYNGSRISPGTKIRMGSTISLVLGDGVGKNEFAVPNIIGWRFADVLHMLEANGLVKGAVLADPGVTDTLNAFVYKQNPPRYSEDKKILHIRSGQTMDVWLQVEKPVQNDSTNQDLREL
jgi:eukaryotic-like serine/threonine-protein kinase